MVSVAIQLPYTGVTTSETMPAPYLGAATIQLPYTSTAQTPFSIGSTIDISTKEDKANKGIANGYAPLDATSKVPSGNLPTIDVSGQITTHNSVTTSVHGIANTANLVLTNDSRLSDSRTPTSHAHGNLTNAGALGITANLPVITTVSGVLTTGTFGATGNSFCQGNDSRLSDTRTPTAHTHAMSDITSLQATLTTHNSLTTSVHGIANTEELIHSGSNTDKIVTFDRSVAGFSDSEIAYWGFGVEDGTREAYIESTGFVASANLSGKSIRIEAEKFIIDGSHQVAFPNASGTLVLASQAIAFAIALG